MKKSTISGKRGILHASILLLSLSVVTPASSYASSPSATPSASAQATPPIHQKSQDDSSSHPNPTATHGLTKVQKDAIAAALVIYKAAIQGALDGANKGIADARSIRDQALAAAPRDKNVRSLALADFLTSSHQIWSAFKTSIAAAKSTFDAAVAAIKANH